MTLCDASALIALINQGDANHDRCVGSLPRLPAPLVTKVLFYRSNVFSRALWRLGRAAGIVELRGRSNPLLYLNSEEQQARMQLLMEQYRDIPMDLADASWVVTAEILNQKQIFTLDRDFKIYRFRGNQPFEGVP